MTRSATDKAVRTNGCSESVRQDCARLSVHSKRGGCSRSHESASAARATWLSTSSLTSSRLSLGATPATPSSMHSAGSCPMDTPARTMVTTRFTVRGSSPLISKRFSTRGSRTVAPLCASSSLSRNVDFLGFLDGVHEKMRRTFMTGLARHGDPETHIAA